jgi:hypothetical protein
LGWQGQHIVWRRICWATGLCLPGLCLPGLCVFVPQFSHEGYKCPKA